GEIEDPAAVRSLDRLFDREEDLRDAIIWAMGEIGNDDADRARRDAFRTLREDPRENEEVWAGELDDSLVEIIRPLPISISTLLGRLRSNNAETRRLAAFKLGLFGIMRRPRIIRAVNPLLDTLRDPVPEVRAMAIWSLDEINPSRWRRNSR
ncbi:HEAT repeat domain-containing protein, partial [Gemmatimonadota bacterium]